MSTIEIIIAVTIHLIIPIAGLLFYFWLIRKMIREKVESPPIVDLFLIFATYGGLLLLTLTSFFWLWSGMASLGVAYLTFVAPLLMGVLAYRNYGMKHLSKYHLSTYKSCLLYFVITPITFLSIIALT